MRYLLAGLILMAALTVEARLGETEAELEKRYGKPDRKRLEAFQYKVAGGYLAIVTFEGGKSVSETYARDKDGNPSAISKEESDAIIRRLYSTPCDCKVSFDDGKLRVSDKAWIKREFDKIMNEDNDANDKAVSGF